MRRLILVVILVFVALGALFLTSSYNQELSLLQNISQVKLPSFFPTSTPIPMTIPSRKILTTDYHIFQTFNNCGPAALSMTLRFYGIKVSQQELGNALRPWQVAGGDNDDKSVTLPEMAEKSKEYGFIPYYRPNGNIEILKKFIANDMPVITRTWTKPNEDIGHYRVVKGYDETQGILIQDDSLQGKNLEYDYDTFNFLWKKLNYEYLVLVPKEKLALADQILGEDKNEKNAWKKALENARKELQINKDDLDARFNLVIALYNTGAYKEAVAEFEKIEFKLSFRTLWYQIEPILAYFQLGNYNRVFEITNRVLDNGNRAFSELYLIRGKIYQKQNNQELARIEFEKAVLYNRNLKEAQELLNSL